MVHSNETLNDAIRLQYLRTSLAAPASTKISHLLQIPANYQTAVSILRDFYDDPVVAASIMFARVFPLPLIIEKNELSLGTCYDTVKEVLATLDMLLTNYQGRGP
jgi:Protein of unknown function (DUF1759)